MSDDLTAQVRAALLSGYEWSDHMVDVDDVAARVAEAMSAMFESTVDGQDVTARREAYECFLRALRGEP